MLSSCYRGNLWISAQVLVVLVAATCNNFIAMVSGWSWTAATPFVDGTAPRVSGHSAVAVKDGVVLFGGLTGAAGSPTTDHLWKYTASTAGWNRILDDTTAATEGPGRRMYAAAAATTDSFYLFGGWDPGAPGSGGTFLDDIWRLDLSTMKWHKQPESLPYPVSRHSACALGDDSIVLHTYRGVLEYQVAGGKLVERETTGEGPDGLSMCATAPLNDRCALVFGGATKTQQMSSDAYVLDTNDWTWHKPKVPADDDNDAAAPSPRASSCAAFVDTNQCLVFGGAGLAPGGYEGGAGLVAVDETWLCRVNADMDSLEWEKLDVGTTVPAGRVAASLTPLPGDDGGFLMQGGYDPASKGTFEAPWILQK